MKNLDIIDKEIQRLEDLKDSVKACEDFIRRNPNQEMCSESYFHNCVIYGEPREVGTVMFVIPDEVAEFIWG